MSRCRRAGQCGRLICCDVTEDRRIPARPTGQRPLYAKWSSPLREFFNDYAPAPRLATSRFPVSSDPAGQRRADRRLYEMAGDIKPVQIGIASVANEFAGNENVRTEVQQFIKLLARITRV